MLKVGVQSAYWFDWGDPDGSMKRFKEYGFETVDFGMPGVSPKNDPITSFYDKSLEEIMDIFRPFKAAADKYGITFCQCHAPFPLWIKDRDDFNQYMVMVMEKICAVCEMIECPNIVAHPITRTLKEVEWETNMQMYRTFMPFAKKHGVKLCLENMFIGFHGHIIGGVCAEADEVCRYIDALNAEAGCDLFGFCFDVGHANLIGANIRQYLQKLGQRLTVLHIHENNCIEDCHMAPYTQVHNGKWTYCDWDNFIQGLRDINYQGELAFETFNALACLPRQLWPQMLQFIAATGRYFRDRITAPEEEAQ